MLPTLIAILACGLAAALWADGARARELATGLAAELCARRGLQLLDDTVALARIGLRWHRGRPRFRRMFGFDYSREGSGRHTGWILLVGTEVERVVLDEPAHATSPQASRPVDPPPPAGDGKVVPFRRPGRRPRE